MSVRAKFRCEAKDAQPSGDEILTTIRLSAVVQGEENKSWSRWTPSGQITLSCCNQAASDQFEVGKEYFIDFTWAVAPAAAPAAPQS